MTECSVCCEAFNKTTRNMISCECKFTACFSCVKIYIIDKSHIEPHCMQCKVVWSKDILNNKFSKYFLNGEYREICEKVIFEEEKTYLPALQEEADRCIKLKKLKGWIEYYIDEKKNNYNNEDQLVRDQRRIDAELCEKEQKIYIKYNQLSRKVIVKENKNFIMKCMVEDCRGFLSDKYKCGLCNTTICKDCHNIQTEDHECKKDDVATVIELNKTTKPCPKCHIRIFKTDGCFAKNQPILMYDGTLKMSQDIILGDILTGDDGEKRTVHHIMTGEDEMYEVKQNNGESYIVNSQHKLVLKYTGDRSLIWNESLKVWKVTWFCRNEFINKSKQFHSKEEGFDKANEFIHNTLTFSDEIEITVSEYINLSETVKNRLFGFKSSNGINYKKQDIFIDPYLLGVWLGDGTHTHPIFASNDYEIQKYIMEWCEKNNAELVHVEDFAFRIRRRGLNNKKDSIGSKQECTACVKSGKNFEICKVYKEYNISNISKSKTNPFMDQLKKYNLIGNKHIPKEYMINDRETRLLVLAGLIDTDGHVSNDGKRATIIQTSPILSNQIIKLARSCGFVVNVRLVERKNKIIFNNLPKDYKDQYHINISGKFFHNIQTILNRKKCVASNPNKDYYRTSIQVISIGKGNFYGWSVDNNKRFLLPDHTVVRNCDQMFCIQCHTVFSWKSGLIESGVVHNPHYFEALRNGKITEHRHRQHNGECGPLPDFNIINSLIKNEIKNNKINEKISRIILYYYQRVLHNRHIVLPTFLHQGNGDDDRLKYLMGIYDEKKFKQKLYVNRQSILRKREEQQIYELYTSIGEEFFRRIKTDGFSHTMLREIYSLVNITSQSIKKLDDKYNHVGMSGLYNSISYDMTLVKDLVDF